MTQVLLVPTEIAEAVVTLNNGAIRLLEQDDVEKALQAFTNLAVLLQHLTHAATSASDVVTITLDQVRDFIHQTSLVLNQVAVPNPLCCLDVYVIEDVDEKAKADAAFYGPSSSIVFPVRLSSDNLAQYTSSECNFRYLTAIVLYNYGLTYRCKYYAASASVGGVASTANTSPTSFLVWAEETFRAAALTLSSSGVKPQCQSSLYRWEMALALVRYSLKRVLEEHRLDEPGSAINDNDCRLFLGTSWSTASIVFVGLSVQCLRSLLKSHFTRSDIKQKKDKTRIQLHCHLKAIARPQNLLGSSKFRNNS